jgi:hypothetical protein
MALIALAEVRSLIELNLPAYERALAPLEHLPCSVVTTGRRNRPLMVTAVDWLKELRGGKSIVSPAMKLGGLRRTLLICVPGNF